MAREFCPHCMKDVPPGSRYCPWCGQDAGARAADHQLPVGTVLVSPARNSFLVGVAKGEGGFGITYIGKELNSGRSVAIKEYFPTRCQPQRDLRGNLLPLEGTGEIYQRGKNSFLSEASMVRAVSGLSSIVQVLDFFEKNNTAYMVMNYLDGVTLRQALRAGQTFEPVPLLQKALPLMRDLGRLHRAGVLHRDIAPDNLMLMPDGSLTLLDFGCARSMEDGRSMTVVLKPGFAPIEQYQTRGQGPYTDIYALCATLYYCITGQVPPAAPDRLFMAMTDSADKLVPPGALGVEMDAGLERLLLWGTELQPTARPGSMEELADRFEARLEELKPPPGPWIEDPPPPPLPPTLWQRLRAGRIWAAGYARTGQRRLQKLLDERAHMLLTAAGAVILGLAILVLVLLFA
ncbi:MAG TPA: protein kinase [Candidatus Fournierella pullicola]|uniref:Protein kinase n=1 Tax=Candidatus Allofournierella pullicola TaxID=2838596 RepID=A0A9D2ACN7_9FIRM|nr:protein kinase [Candidatus Fournierella pullicola]